MVLDIDFCAEYSVTLGNVSPLGYGPILSFYVRILEILSDELVHSSRCKNRPNGPCNINPLQSLYLAAAYIVKMILMVV